jgi:ribosomal protein S12 methylthiotransferase
MSLSVYIETLGCSKNLVDSEIMTGLLTGNDFKITLEPYDADVIVVNTCSFIRDAKEESIDEIFNLLDFKKQGSCQYFIVTGCLSERYSSDLYKEIPEVDAFLGTTTFQGIIHVIEELKTTDKRIIRVGDIDEEIDENLSREILTPNHFAYVKISEGCDNKCTYCIIPKLRGKYRSRKIEDIVNEVEQLADNGVKEIILIAQDTARYGIDLYDDYKLADLLHALEQVEGIEWIRILYSYPDVIDDRLINEIKTNEKVVNYIDMPIQHVNDEILKRMNRKTSKEKIKQLIHKLRQEIPDITIRTTLIVGFPGETKEQFEVLYDFVKEMKFSKLGVFGYSDEEGTPAYNFNNKIDSELIAIRRNKILELQQEISEENNYQYLDQTLEVIVEERLEEDNIYLGRTKYNTPEVDGIVYIHSSQPLTLGEFIEVKITDTLEYDLIGEY